MIWYPLRGPSPSSARIAARTSPRPAFGPRAEPGGPGHQPPQCPPNVPGPPGPPGPGGHCLVPFERPEPRSHGPPRQPGPCPRLIPPTAPWIWLSTRATDPNISKRRGSKSPALEPAIGILTLPTSRSRYDHDISSAYNPVRPGATHSVCTLMGAPAERFANAEVLASWSGHRSPTSGRGGIEMSVTTAGL